MPEQFWYGMTWNQTLNIYGGYLKAIKEEHERHIVEARVHASLIGNLFASEANKKTASQIYPISLDNVEKVEKKQNTLSIEQFFKILSAAYENSKTE